MPRLLFPVVFTLCLVASAQADIYSANEALARGEFAAAAREFKALAEAGDAGAQASLGYLYYAGEGVPRDYEQAVFWHRKAAVQGNRDAQYNLAVAYAFGEGLGRDLAEAALWYRRAAEQGHALAQYSLGLSYANGEGVAQDPAEAARWFQAAAGQGYAPAQLQLANLYNSGAGAPRDYAEAARWYRSAAEQGDADAQYQLGALYEAGKGVKQDAASAAGWYARAADQGHIAAAAGLKALEKPAPAPETGPAAEADEAQRPGLLGIFSGLFGAEPAPSEEEATAVPASRAEPEAGEAAAAKAGNTVAAVSPDAAPKSAPETGPVAGAGEAQRSGLLGFFGGLFGAKPAPSEEEATAVPLPRAEPAAGEAAAEKAGNTVAAVSPDAAPKSTPETGPVAGAGEAQRRGFLGIFSGLFGAEPAPSEEEATAIPAPRVEPAAGEAAAAKAGNTVAAVSPDAAPKSAPETGPVAESGEAQRSGFLGFFGGLFGAEPAPSAAAEVSAVPNPRVEPAAGEAADARIGAQAANTPRPVPMAQKEAPPPTEPGLLMSLLGNLISPERGEAAAGGDSKAPQAAQMAAVGPAGNGGQDALSSLRALAARGDRGAQYELGRLYYAGDQVGQDPARAALWYRRAAEQGEAAAQASLAELYLNGEGVSPDRARAVYWYGLAAEQGHRSARDRLAGLQETRPAPAVSPEPPPQPARNSARADYERGLGYAQGAGAARDAGRAFGYFQEAARAGHAPAMYRLGLAYAYGEGVRRNYERAAEWYRKAALQGHAIAQRNLALMYLNGTGIKPDRARALAWYEIVAGGGKALDVYRRDRLRAELSETERQTATELAGQISGRLGEP